ncbi:MAG: cell division protein ZapD [Candidatus Phlomobacter fragariae]
MNFWIDGILTLRFALNMLLNLIQFTSQKSYNGFYQNSIENADLIRIKLPINLSLYPQISGHKTRFAIRFLHKDS